MGSSTVVVSKVMYDELKRYAAGIWQEGKPAVDADFNDEFYLVYMLLRRLTQNSIGDGAMGDAFKVAESVGVPNDFLITGAAVSMGGPARLFVKGHPCCLNATENYTDGAETSAVSIGLEKLNGTSKLHDSSANWAVNVLIGQSVVPDITDGTAFVIVANGATWIEATGDMPSVAAPGDKYKVLLTMPVGVPRVDVVWLDVYLDEIDANEDPDLVHTIGGINIESMRRWKIIQVVRVEENVADAPSYPTFSYVDADGNEHVVYAIAKLGRAAGDDMITAAMITDLRRHIFALDEIDALYVNVSGDTMEGDLTFLPGCHILGTDIIVDPEVLKNEIIYQDHLALTDDGGLTTHLKADGDAPSALPFDVHDNRYMTKSELEGITGNRLFPNGAFTEGLRGWINDAPLVLYGTPRDDAYEDVQVGCDPGCGMCKGAVRLHINKGSRVCWFVPIAQKVKINCGGRFLANLHARVQEGLDTQKADFYASFGYYSSGQLVGVYREKLNENDVVGPSASAGDRKECEIADFIDMTKEITVPNYVDEIVVSLEVWLDDTTEGDCGLIVDMIVALKGFQLFRMTPKENISALAEYDKGRVPIIEKVNERAELVWKPTSEAQQALEITMSTIRSHGIADEDGIVIDYCPTLLPDQSRAFSFWPVECIPVGTQKVTDLSVRPRQPLCCSPMSIFDDCHIHWEDGNGYGWIELVKWCKNNVEDIPGGGSHALGVITERSYDCDLVLENWMAAGIASWLGENHMLRIWLRGPYVGHIRLEFVDNVGKKMWYKPTLWVPQHSGCIDIPFDNGNKGEVWDWDDGFGPVIKVIFRLYGAVNPNRKFKYGLLIGKLAKTDLAGVELSVVEDFEGFDSRTAMMDEGWYFEQHVTTVEGCFLEDDVIGRELEWLSGIDKCCRVVVNGNMEFVARPNSTRRSYEKRPLGMETYRQLSGPEANWSANLRFNMKVVSTNGVGIVRVVLWDDGEKMAWHDFTFPADGAGLYESGPWRELSVLFANFEHVDAGFSWASIQGMFLHFLHSVDTKVWINDIWLSGGAVDLLIENWDGYADQTAMAAAWSCDHSCSDCWGDPFMFDFELKTYVPPHPIGHAKAVEFKSGMGYQSCMILQADLRPTWGESAQATPQDLSAWKVIQLWFKSFEDGPAHFEPRSSIWKLRLCFIDAGGKETFVEVKEVKDSFVAGGFGVGYTFIREGEWEYPCGDFDWAHVASVQLRLWGLDPFLKGDFCNGLAMMPVFLGEENKVWSFAGIDFYPCGKPWWLNELPAWTIDFENYADIVAVWTEWDYGLADAKDCYCTGVEVTDDVGGDAQEGILASVMQVMTARMESIWLCRVKIDADRKTGLNTLDVTEHDKIGVYLKLLIGCAWAEEVPLDLVLEDYEGRLMKYNMGEIKLAADGYERYEIEGSIAEGGVGFFEHGNEFDFEHVIGCYLVFNNPVVHPCSCEIRDKKIYVPAGQILIDSFCFIDDGEEVLPPFDRFGDEPAVWKSAVYTDPYLLRLDAPILCGTIPMVAYPSPAVRDVRYLDEPGYEQADLVLTKGLVTNKTREPDPDTGAEYGKLAYKEESICGVRSHKLDFAYMAAKDCLGVTPVEKTYVFHPDGSCGCPKPSDPQDLSGPITDDQMCRILPDDGFGVLPTGYEEAFWLEFCQIDGSWYKLSSKDTAPQTIYFAGGGRSDPAVPPGTLGATVYCGPGGGDSQLREQYLIGGPYVVNFAGGGTQNIVFTVAPGETVGFAVGQRVWIRHELDPNDTRRKLRLFDVDKAMKGYAPSFYPDYEIAGVYGEIKDIDPMADTIEVRFDGVTDYPYGIVSTTFTITGRAVIMVSPKDAMGFYWEATPDLIAIAPTDWDKKEKTFIKWGFRYWQLSEEEYAKFNEDCAYCPVAEFISGGDGKLKVYDLASEVGKDVIDPREWASMWNSPGVVTDELLRDACRGNKAIKVCYPRYFDVGDKIIVWDDDCPTGFVAIVKEVWDSPAYMENPEPPPPCIEKDSLEAMWLVLDVPVPGEIMGYPAFDGKFSIERNAKVMRIPVVDWHMKVPTELVHFDGEPRDGEPFIGIDYEQGLLVLYGVPMNQVRVWWKQANKMHKMPWWKAHYRMRGVALEEAGAHSLPIEVTGVAVRYQPDGVPDYPTNEPSYAGYRSRITDVQDFVVVFDKVTGEIRDVIYGADRDADAGMVALAGDFDAHRPSPLWRVEPGLGYIRFVDLPECVRKAPSEFKVIGNKIVRKGGACLGIEAVPGMFYV